MITCQVCGEENEEEKVCFNCGSQIRTVQSENQQFPFEKPIKDDRISSSKFQRHRYEPNRLYNTTIYATFLNPVTLIVIFVLSKLELPIGLVIYTIFTIIQILLVVGFFYTEGKMLQRIRNFQVFYSFILITIGSVLSYFLWSEFNSNFSMLLASVILIVVNTVVIYVIYFNYETKMVFAVNE